jgi:hypothetical protein
MFRLTVPDSASTTNTRKKRLAPTTNFLETWEKNTWSLKKSMGAIQINDAAKGPRPQLWLESWRFRKK